MADREYVQACIQAQKNYCSEKRLPHFAPRDGYCYDCNQMIYDDVNGITLERASSSLITSCPICRKSYCD